MAAEVARGVLEMLREIQLVERRHPRLLRKVADFAASRKGFYIETTGIRIRGGLSGGRGAARKILIGIGENVHRFRIVERAAEQLRNRFIIEAKLDEELVGDFLLDRTAEQLAVEFVQTAADPDVAIGRINRAVGQSEVARVGRAGKLVWAAGQTAAVPCQH